MKHIELDIRSMLKEIPEIFGNATLGHKIGFLYYAEKTNLSSRNEIAKSSPETYNITTEPIDNTNIFTPMDPETPIFPLSADHKS
jgi:hypothetical protein